MTKKLYRSTKDRVFAGICSGLAKYINLDVSIIRIITLLLILSSVGTGLIIYIIAAMIIPVEMY